MNLAILLELLLQAGSPTAPPPSGTLWENRIGLLFAATGAALAGIAGTYKLVTKLIRDSRTARAVEEQKTQSKIDEAVKKAKDDMSHQIELSQQLTEHWRDMAGIFEKEKNHDREVYESNLNRIRTDETRLRAERTQAMDDLAVARIKIEEVVDLNLGLQGQITENTRRIKELEARANSPTGGAK